MNTKLLPFRRRPRKNNRLALIALAGLLFSTLAITAAPASAQTPTCASADSDSDGDGWGWENNQSCRVQVDAPAQTTNSFDACTSRSSDPDGDGWGYENGASCLSAVSLDSKGGQEANESLQRNLDNGFEITRVSAEAITFRNPRDLDRTFRYGSLSGNTNSNSRFEIFDNSGDHLVSTDLFRTFNADGVEVQRFIQRTDWYDDGLFSRTTVTNLLTGESETTLNCTSPAACERHGQVFG